MARKGVYEVSEFTGKGAMGTAGRGPEGTLAGEYDSQAAGLSGLANSIGRLADRQAATEGALAGTAAGLDGKPELKGRASIYGASYEEAALRTYANRLDSKAMDGAFALFEQHQDDPAALAKGLNDFKQQMLQEDVLDDPRAKALFEQQFNNTARSYYQSAVGRADARAKDERLALATTTAAKAQAENQRVAFAGGADLATAQAHHDTILDRAVADGAMTPSAAAALKVNSRKALVEAQVKGEFSRLPPAERAGYARNLMADWQAGKGPLKDLDFASVQNLAADLEKDVRSDEIAGRTARAVVLQQADKIRKMSAQGLDISDSEWSDVEAAAARVDGGPEQVAALRSDAATLKSWRNMNPRALEQALQEDRARVAAKGGATELDTERLARGDELLKNMSEALAADPLGWAERTGLSDVPAIDFSRPETMAARAPMAEEIARNYGVRPRYLRPDEAAAVKAAEAQGGEAMLGTVAGIVQGFGDKAPRVLAEVSGEAPLLARAGALVNAGGSQALARDVAETLARRNAAASGAPGPAPASKAQLSWMDDKASAKLTEKANEVYGSVFTAVPGERLAAEGLGRAAIETRLPRLGLTADTGATATDEAITRVYQEAAGATYGPDGTRYGGVADRESQWGAAFGRARGGYKVIVPANVRADRIDAVIDGLTDRDMAKLGPAQDGRPVPASVVKNGYLVATRAGRYRVAAGEPAGNDPQYLLRPDGSYWELDFNALEGDLRTRMPAAFKGGPQ